VLGLQIHLILNVVQVVWHTIVILPTILVITRPMETVVGLLLIGILVSGGMDMLLEEAVTHGLK